MNYTLSGEVKRQSIFVRPLVAAAAAAAAAEAPQLRACQ